MTDDSHSAHERNENQHGHQDQPGRQPSSDEMLPAKSSGRQRSGQRQRNVADRDTCLEALSRLPGLTVMGVVTTAQTNAIRATYTAILQEHHRSQAGRDQGQLDTADVLATLRENPQVLSLLEPLLTDEQIAQIMEASGGGDDGQT